jgi:alkanesulfonate monooxygenase SsuD/methylene tetrahydromethanopterin reductase-like flavin-dependent oxidoreductase (luciferase family)
VRFAIKTRPEHQTWAHIRDVWVAADEIELSESAWNWDHFYPLSGDTTGPNLEGWTSLAALGQATRRIRIGWRAGRSSGTRSRRPPTVTRARILRS